MNTAVAVLHVLAASVWVGGTVALVLIAVPYARTLEGERRAAALRALGRGWRPIGWGALAVLVATGIHLAGQDGILDGSAPTKVEVVFGVKAGLVAALVAGAFLHDFVLGPGLARQIQERKPQTLRRPLVLVGWANFTLTVSVPVLGVVLARLG